MAFGRFDEQVKRNSSMMALIKQITIKAIFVWTVLASLAASAEAQSPSLQSKDGKFLGSLNANPYDPNSVNNPFGRYGSPFSQDSLKNPFGNLGSLSSPASPTNPYASDPPQVRSNDGQYLGDYSNRPYDPNSTGNPFGRFGSPFSPDSINNPFGRYGSPFSPEGATNPFGQGQQPRGQMR
jgi:hypothetical protein